MLAFDFHIYACISTGISYFEGDLTSFIHSFILTLSLLNFQLLFRSFRFSHTLSLLHFPYHPIEFTKKKLGSRSMFNCSQQQSFNILFCFLFPKFSLSSFYPYSLSTLCYTYKIPYAYYNNNNISQYTFCTYLNRTRTYNIVLSFD